MTWSDFYLICFAVGFLFSLLSFVAGGLNAHGHWHMHGLHFHAGDAHAAGGSGASPHGHGSPTQSVSPFNFFTIAIFLAWFGGTGYLLTRYSTIVFALGLAISTAVGLAGASIVFMFLAKVLMRPEALMAKTAPARSFTRKLEAGAPVRRAVKTASPLSGTPK